MPLPPPSRPSRRAGFRAPGAGRPRALPAAAAALLVFAVAGPARADICKYSDAEGNIYYSNVAPEKGWKKLGCAGADGGSITPAPAAKGSSARASSSPTPPGFPKVDVETQRGRDDVRRKVLAEELATEEKLLVEARASYADGAPPPLPEERADAEKYRVRIAKLRQGVSIHEKNVEALKKELASVR